MTGTAVALLLLCGMAAAQNRAPIPDAEVPQRKEIFRNAHVIASLLELAPGEATPMHQHDRDMLTVFASGGQTRHMIYGHRVVKDRIAPGMVRFRSAGF